MDHDGRRRRLSGAAVSAGLATRLGPRPPTPYARSVLDAVDLVPTGQAATYGDIAEWLGRGGPRAVGTALSRHGREVAWWRIVRADGLPASPHLLQAVELLRGEGCPMNGDRVDLSRARWDGGRPPPERSAGPDGAVGPA